MPLLDILETAAHRSTDEERLRLQCLYGHDILDTPPDGSFDRITALAAKYFKVPIALVTLVDEDRIWFKSRHGLDAAEIPRSPGLCASAIFSESVYVVTNAVKDIRTLANPLVAGEFGLRFYAAAPLVTHDGFGLGTLCIIDREPREFSEEDQGTLRDFGSLVMNQMELRLSSRKMVSSLTRFLLKAQDTDRLDEMITVCSWSNKVLCDGEWLTFTDFLTSKLCLSVTHGMHPDEHRRLLADII